MTLNQIAHIRANSGIDRELDRYLTKLQVQQDNMIKFDIKALSKEEQSNMIDLEKLETECSSYYMVLRPQ